MPHASVTLDLQRYGFLARALAQVLDMRPFYRYSTNGSPSTSPAHRS